MSSVSPGRTRVLVVLHLDYGLRKVGKYKIHLLRYRFTMFKLVLFHIRLKVDIVDRTDEELRAFQWRRRSVSLLS